MTMVPGINENNPEESEEFIINQENEEEGTQEDEEVRIYITRVSFFYSSYFF